MPALLRKAAREDQRVRTILFVDDHPIFRDGFQRNLESEVADLTVLSAADAKSALRTLESGRDVDLLLTDYKLPDQDGLALIAAARRLFPTMGTGLLCADLTFAVMAQARALGVLLCMSKARGTGDLVAAIRIVFQGGQVYDGDVSASAGGPVSPRRREILLLASKGQADKAIAEQLGVSENTVRNHWKYIFDQLEVNSRTEAVGKAIRQGMI
jgi:DNA-binding NarL/FixJ family response regulator